MRDSLKHKEESLTEGIAEAAGAIAEDVSKLGKATREAASKEASELYQMGQEKAQVVGKQVQNYVKEYPLRTLLIAAGVGFVLGFMKRGR